MESERVEGMNPKNVFTKFARVQKVMEKYGIKKET